MVRPQRSPYEVVERLIKTLDVLRQGPATACQIYEAVLQPKIAPTEYQWRKSLRDVRALQRLGYQIDGRGKPLVFTLMGGPLPFLTNDDIQVLALLRDTYATGHPQTPAVRQLLERLTASLDPQQHQLYHRRPALRIPLRTAIDYQQFGRLVSQLDEAIFKRQQIAFDYRSLHAALPVRHPKLDPYAIEFFNNQYYLLAYSYTAGRELEFRIDRIVQHDRSPELLRSVVQPERRRQAIAFTYRLPARFVEHGVSERFTVLGHRVEGEWAYIQAEGRSSFWILKVLMSYAEKVLIVEPDWLREEFVATLRHMLHVHDVDTGGEEA